MTNGWLTSSVDLCAKEKRRSAHERSGVQMQDSRSLKGEINSRPGHSEIIVRPVDYVPTEIGDPTDVRRDANFEAAAKLPHSSGFCFMVDALHSATRNDNMLIVAAKDSAATRPDVR